MHRVTPDNIQTLQDNEVFVFGSNKDGLHYGGAARLAHEKFGAVMGNGKGFQGQSYAINTMSGIDVMKEEVDWFIRYAKQFTKVPVKFLVTELGCGIAGYSPSDIAPFFKKAIEISNIYLPQKFWEVLNDPNN